jgi:hypothetical protein
MVPINIPINHKNIVASKERSGTSVVVMASNAIEKITQKPMVKKILP